MADERAIDRRAALRGIGLAGMAGIAGCVSEPATETDGEGDGDGTDMGEPTYVGMVYATGGLGDGSFNDQAQQGIQQAADELNVDYNESQPEEVSDFSNFQQQYAQSTDPDYDLVSCIGFQQTDALATNAQDFSDQEFMIVDSVVESDNVGSYLFREHEGSFLVGVMAGMLTSMDFAAGAGSTDGDSTNVGFVGGVQGDLIGKFEAGYTAGVKQVNESVDVRTNYVGDFNDPTGGKEAALSMYNSGADVVYHAAGNTGTGVFQAAQEQGRFAIGVDRRQSVTRSSFADVILGSMIKRVDTAVYTAVEAKANGEFQGGSIITLGLEEEGVGAVYGDQLGSEVPQEVKDEVDSVRESIINGDISVPSDPDNA